MLGERAKSADRGGGVPPGLRRAPDPGGTLCREGAERL